MYKFRRTQIISIINNQPPLIHIDNITFTSKLTANAKKHAYSTLDKLNNSGRLEDHPQVLHQTLPKRKVHNKSKKSIHNNYKEIIRFYIPNGRSPENLFGNSSQNFWFTISYKPICENRNGKRGPIRIEFNPNSLRWDGLILMCEILKTLFGSFTKEIILKSRVTRVDVCCDTDLEISFRDIFCYMPKFEIQKFHYDNALKVLSGIVIGKKDVIARIYDRLLKKERVASGSQGQHEHRFELQIRDIGTSIADLDKNLFTKRFSKVKFFSPSLLEDEYFEDSFIEDVTHHSLVHALKKYKGRDRRNIIEHLKSHHTIPSPFDLENINIDELGIITWLLRALLT